MIGGLIETFTTGYAYVLFALLLATGLYMMIASENLVKKLIGVNMFQTAIFLFFVTAAYVEGGTVPVIPEGSEAAHASPLPHVIVLTAIVVGVSLTAVGLTLIVRIHREYGTLREDVLTEVRADDRR